MKYAYSKLFFVLLGLLLSASTNLQAQYCLPTFSVGCTSSDIINNFSTTGGVVNITNNGSGCNGTLPNSYIFNSGMTVSQVQGLPFNFSVQCGATWAQAFRIWVDWNHDFDFSDPGEDVYVSPSSGFAPYTGTINVPATAVPGVTRMRVLCRWITIPALTDYCGTTMSFGECEDYNMSVIAATPCTGTPIAGTANAAPNNPCPGIPVLLSTTGTSLFGGLAYQWQRASTPSGPWINIGITNPMNYLPPPGSTTFYRCIVTCTFTGLNDTTLATGAVVVQPWSPTSACWCIPTYANGGTQDHIINVTLGTLTNNTAAAGNPSPFYVNYTPFQTGPSATLATPSLFAGIPTTLTISYGTDPSQYGAFWIDYNHNGAFDTIEYVSPNTNAGPSGTHTITFTPPGTSLPGVTRLRIRAGDDVQMNATQPCGPTNSTWGETEDYLVNIIPAGPFDPALTNLVAPVGNLCTDSNQTLTATVCNYGSTAINLVANPVTVTFNVNGPSGLVTYTQVLNTGTLGAFGVGCQTVVATPVNMFMGGNYLINAQVSCPTVSNAFLSNDSLSNAISITNYRPTASPPYNLCQYNNIPFGQGLGVGGCSAPISDSVTINFTITGPCNDGNSDALSCQFATGILPTLVPGASITNAVLRVTNLATIGSSWMSEMRFNVYGSAPTGANIYSPGVQMPGSAASASSNFTYQRTIAPTAQFLNMFSLAPGSAINIGYWESSNDVAGSSDININGGGTTTATLKIYYQYVPPSFAWYDVPTGGTSLYSLSPFDPFLYPNAVVNNSNVTGTYTFYAACLGLPSCRVPVDLIINPTPAAFQDTISLCEYAVGANNAIFILDTTHSVTNVVTGGNLAADVIYFYDQALITQITDVNNDTSSTNFIYSKVFYPATGCYSSDSVLLDVHSIPQFSLPIYIGNACAPNAIDISSLINLFPTTNIDTLFFQDAAYTIPFVNPYSITTADSVYMIVNTNAGVVCSDSAIADIQVIPATNNIANQDLSFNFSICGPVPCGNITLGDGNTETLYTTADCRKVATITDALDGVSLGAVTICEDIDCATPVHNGQPYVNRNYEITPSVNDSALVCLYYLDQDFADYSSTAFTSTPAWPVMSPTTNLCIAKVDGGNITTPGHTAISIPNSSITATYDALTTVWTVCFPVSSFSTFYCHTCNPLNIPLPVSLLSFTGQRINGQSALQWITSNEENNSHFVVERSKDAKNFKAISSKIPTKAISGNSSSNLSYDYTDITPLDGHNYYRLQQVDIDGNMSHSEVIDIYYGNESLVTLYPNPVSSELNIDINSSEATTAHIKIMDATGRVVRIVDMMLQAGSNTGKIDIRDLTDGMYLVDISSSTGLHYSSVIRKK
ncbi:MAG: T9SS type A sorting domain-containing protein [Bacteroidetes bacterium]|nr:T9SS type A sorting domain-containing protein [Bacteroidota bacterium]